MGDGPESVQPGAPGSEPEAGSPAEAGPPAGVGESPAGGVRPAAIAFGAATAALAASIGIVEATSNSKGSTVASPSLPTGAPTPSPSVSPSQTPSPSPSLTPSAPAGPQSWTGSMSADGSGAPVGIRLDLDTTEKAAVTGMVYYADPDTGEWAPAGDLAGTLDGTALSLTATSDAAFELAFDGKTMSGTGELFRGKQPRLAQQDVSMPPPLSVSIEAELA